MTFTAKVAQGLYAIASVGILSARWAWAKLRGKPWDNGMDM